MLEAKIISGKGRGRGLGFPTINLEIPENFNSKEGIYACTVLLNNAMYKGALHFGPVPVFHDKEQALEIFVLGWNGDQTPEQISFEIGRFLRPVQNFETPEALSAQIAQDVANIQSS